MNSFWLTTALSFLSCGLFRGGSVSAFDISRSDNVAVYWGQNSYGATHSDTANFQQNLSYYCQDDSIDALPLAFLNVFFDAGDLPSLDLANICSTSGDPVFSGTDLPDCSFIASDIETCQSKGKIVTLSLGGATGAASFTSADQASSFGDTIWNLFLGGSSDTRPFGSAVLDGIDLDIEGGSTEYFDSFISRIRTLAEGTGKTYYFSAAPQCPFPDAYMSTVLNAASFDAVYVQFYNNYCSLPNFNNTNDWNFADWDNWAKNTSPNPDVKIYIGAPASSTAAGSGYVDVTTLGSIAVATRNQYSSFGGVMLWDASQAYANDRFDLAIKNAIQQSGNGGTTSNPSTVSVPSTTSTPASTTTSSTATTTTPATSSPATSTTSTSIATSTTPTTTSAPSTTSTTTSATATSTATSGSCANVPTWVSNVAYNGGQQVVYNGHLWTANWWSYADVPGGVSGDWTDDGACTSFAAAIPTQRSAFMSALSPAVAPTQGS